jgi:hypothetical protein
MSEFVPFAERMLRENGEFFPFGGALTVNGEVVSVAAYDGREQPPSDDVIALRRPSLKARGLGDM